eukprot:67978_1
MPTGGQSRLGRGTKHRLAMMKNMVTSLICHERIKTTLARAKSLRIIADKLVTRGKEGTLASRRLAGKYIQDRGALKKLFDVLGPRYQYRPGGYTRVLKLGRPRAGDKADMAVIEFVDRRGELRRAKQVAAMDSDGLKDLITGGSSAADYSTSSIQDTKHETDRDR